MPRTYDSRKRIPKADLTVRVKPVFKDLKEVRIDHKTSIYVKKSKNSAKAKADFLEKINRRRQINTQI